MKRLFANALMLVGLTTSSQIMALGLGELTLKSALNQPLVAEIDLVDTAGLSAEEMRPSLATQAAFERAGVDRSYFLTKIRFNTVGNKIVLTTRDAVTEPFLNFLVEVNWPSGRVLREYTVLLDPPTFDGDTIRPLPSLAADTAPAPVKAPAVSAEEQESITAVLGVLAQTDNKSAKPAAAPVAAAPKAQAPVAPVAKPQPPLSPVSVPPVARANSSKPAARSESSGNAGSDSYQVQPNDTLWSIALATRPDSSVSPQQMMVAIQRENPQAFVEGNINRLKTNQTLRIPAAEEVRAVSRDAAVSEVQRQNQELGRGNAQLDATGRAASSSASKRSETGGEVKLVSATGSDNKSGGASGDVQRGSGTNSVRQQALENDLAIALENLDKSRRENQDLAERLKALEEQISTLQRLVTLKDDQLANMQGGAKPAAPGSAPAVPATAQSPATAPATAQNPATASATAQNPVTAQSAEGAATAPAGVPAAATEPGAQPAVAPEPKPVPKPVPPKPVVLPEPVESDLIGDLLADPVTAGGLAGVVLLALGGGLVAARKRRGGKPESDKAEKKADKKAAKKGKAESGDETPDLAAAAVAGGAVVAGAAVADSVTDDDFTFKGASEVSALDVSGDFLNNLDMADNSAAAGPSMADILAEADMAIAYGNFDEAADKLQKAISAQPDHAEYALKLLEVFAESDNAEAFADEESRLQAAFGDFYHDQVGSLRSRLTNPVELDHGYGDVSLDDLSMEFQSGLDDDLDKKAAATVGDDLQAELDSGVDFADALDLGGDDHGSDSAADKDALSDLELDVSSLADEDETNDDVSAVAVGGDLDFDLSAFDEPALVDEEPEAAVMEDDENSLNFDLGSLDSLQSETDSVDVSEDVSHDNLMDFDLSGLDAIAEEAPVAEVAVDDSNLMDFDLSGLDSVAEEAPVAEVTADDSNLMDFDLSGLDSVAEEASVAEVAADDSNLMDFDLSGLELPVAEEPVAEVAEVSAADDNLMDFDLSGLELPVAEESVAEESVEESAADDDLMDFDLSGLETSADVDAALASDDLDLGDLEAELGAVADSDLDLSDLEEMEALPELSAEPVALDLDASDIAAEVAAEDLPQLDDLDPLADLDARLDAADELGVPSLDLSDLENLAELDDGESAVEDLDLADLELGEVESAASDDLADLSFDGLEELPELTLDAAEELPELTLDAAEELPELTLDATEELPELTLDATEELPELTLDAAEELPELTLDAAEELPELSLDATEELPELSLDDLDSELDTFETETGNLADLSMDGLADLDALGGNDDLSDLSFDGLSNEPVAEEEQVFELDNGADTDAFELVDADDLPDLDFANTGDLPDLEDLPELDSIIDSAPVAPAVSAVNGGDIDLDALADAEDEFEFLSSTDECATKLDLARVYVDMGDADGARDLLAEIVQEGSDQQKQEARSLLNSIA